ncbi:MAG: pesticin C-terminus-like muramidase [Azoarcus sp.]|jgi:GH24 family phage-related lysozyme (muramidase)|nr:pesticin C-terminus-like muramidase [Azoarcus sp.]
MAEKQRIAKLRWWDKVKGHHGFPASHVVYHFHPLAVIGNFGKMCSSKECDAEYYELEVNEGVIYRVSKETFKFILDTEAYAEYPYVPGSSNDQNSGITIGYGYDLGQQSEFTIRNNLSGIYAQSEIDRFVTVRGKRGDDARTELNTVNNISISRDNAMRLAMIMKRDYAKKVVAVYPQVVKYHPHCQGAMLSLVINRGNALTASTTLAIARRKEMKDIQTSFANGMPEEIPQLLRNMKVLWTPELPNNPRFITAYAGLVTRREKEAVFFERGLTCICFSEK